MIIQQNDLLEAIKSKFERKAAYDSFNNLALYDQYQLDLVTPSTPLMDFKINLVEIDLVRNSKIAYQTPQ